jgi:hypothetical protein
MRASAQATGLVTYGSVNEEGNMSGTGMDRRRAELPPAEQMTFEAVRRVIEEMGAAIIAERRRKRDRTRSGAWLASRRQEVVEAGLNEFDRQRRLSSDERVPRWREPVRGVMEARAAEVFDESRDDDGSLPRDGDGPCRTPGGGHAVPPIARGKYMATRDQLAGYTRWSAERAVGNHVGSWTNDSEMPADMIQVVAAHTVEKALATWDADQAPLLRYVDVLVRYAVLDEHRRGVRALVRSRRVIAACTADLAGGDALRTAVEEDHDPLARLLAVEDVRQRAALARALDKAIEMLTPVLRDEVRRRLDTGTCGTPLQQMRYSRALAKLRELLADHAPTV